MPRVSAAFFALGVVCLFIGMCMGAKMGASEDFTLMPAHAHLNLLGWVTMAIYGTFYALTHASLKPKLAWINFWLSALGVVLMVPSLALYLPAHDAKFVPGILAGEVATIGGLLTFAISVYRELVRPRLA
jgi:heme/copper-type cytochrome/quinol oxidase subunit 1